MTKNIDKWPTNDRKRSHEYVRRQCNDACNVISRILAGVDEEEVNDISNMKAFWRYVYLNADTAIDTLNAIKWAAVMELSTQSPDNPTEDSEDD